MNLLSAAEPSDVSRNITKRLTPIIQCLRLSAEREAPVVLETLGGHFKGASFLPVYLHVLNPGCIGELSINSSYGVFPFPASERRLVESYKVALQDVFDLRKEIRWNRCMEGTDRPGDLGIEDWMEGYSRNMVPLSNRRLPVTSIIPIDLMDSQGNIHRGGRNGLGQYAVRNAYRPSIITLSSNTTIEPGFSVLSSVDVLIINGQGVRGKKAVDSIRRILEHRLPTLPTVVLVQGAVDYFRLQMKTALIHAEICLHSVLDEVNTGLHSAMSLSIVGQDRIQNERIINEELDELRVISSEAATLARSAKNAWWNARQNLGVDSSQLPAVNRWVHRYQERRLRNDSEIQLFNSVHRMIENASQDINASKDRLTVVKDRVLNSHVGLVDLICRDRFQAEFLGDSLARTLDVSLAELCDLGITCHGAFDLKSVERSSHVVFAGYYGADTLDAVMQLQPCALTWVVDPIESSWMQYDIKRLIDHYTEVGAESLSKQYMDLDEKLSRVVVSTSLYKFHVTPLNYDTHLSDLRDPRTLDLRHNLSTAKSVEVAFTNGSSMYAQLDSSVQTISGGRVSKLISKRVSELEPGDEVVIVIEDVRSKFSERILDALDRKLLKKESLARKQWVSIVYATLTSRTISTRQMHDVVKRLGSDVSLGTLKTWIPQTPVDSAISIPQNWIGFRNFAEALGLGLPQTYLREIFDNVRRWRAVHRKSGRDLVRVLRGAYFGFLDPATTFQVENRWEINLRELIQGVDIYVVDEIVDMEGEADATINSRF